MTARTQSQAEPILWLLIALSVWLIGGVLSLFGALSYAELGAMDKSSGGLYAFTRDAFGRFPAQPCRRHPVARER